MPSAPDLPTALEKASDKAGLAPGTLVAVSTTPPQASRITVVDYNQNELHETRIGEIEELLPYRQRDTVTWVNIEGLGDIEHIRQLGELFGVHPLVLEDIINTHQRPKFEDYDEYLFIVLKKIEFPADSLDLGQEQFSILVMKNFVFTFNERPTDNFEAVKQRIRNSKSRFRSLGSDYLTYALMDAVVDSYFGLVDRLDFIIDELEDKLLLEPDSQTLTAIQKLKRQTIFIRRLIVPVRELVSAMLRSDTDLIQERARIYLRDVHDHAIRIAESLETFRDIITGMLDIYLSSISNKMNEVMKVLTIFATLFIPLTFVAGIYGMNFEYMPELKWKWGYPAIWLVFIVTAVSLLLFFRRRKWL